MAAKRVARKATKPRAAKRAARRVTRKAARKARRAAKPKAPKKAARKPRAPKSKKAVRRTKVKKVKKPKRVTKKMLTGTYRKVWNGTCTYTKGGLTKKDLMLNPKNKVVSKKKFAAGQRLQKNSKSGGWMAAVAQARKELGITGFCTVNRGAQGVALYKRAKELFN